MTYHAYVLDSGELVLPADLARALGLRPGDGVEVERQGDSIGLKMPRAASGSVFRDEVDRFVAERASDWDD
jgi:bifunctional DNA-binding transcriptional regulator/antitoxin component of YhaV-PrlF toxin-antitoxin module